ncbi:MAG: MarR family transcriptional regulator, partial [Polyangia bacterium]
MPRHKTVRPLEAHLGFWLRFVSNHVSQAFSRRLAAHEVSVAEWVVLRELLEQDGALPSDLAER